MLTTLGLLLLKGDAVLVTSTWPFAPWYSSLHKTGSRCGHSASSWVCLFQLQIPGLEKITLRPVQGWLDPQRDDLALRFDQLSGFIRSCLDWLTTVTFLVHWKWVSVQNRYSQIPKHGNYLLLFPQCTLTLVKGCISLWEMLGEGLTVYIWGQF